MPCNRDGRLQEADQILAINRQPLDQTITHHQAIGILQKAKDSVQLVVARGSLPQLISPVVSRSPSAASTISAHSNPVSTLDSLGKLIYLLLCLLVGGCSLSVTLLYICRLTVLLPQVRRYLHSIFLHFRQIAE